jgi:hypothetical protein
MLSCKSLCHECLHFATNWVLVGWSSSVADDNWITESLTGKIARPSENRRVPRNLSSLYKLHHICVFVYWCLLLFMCVGQCLYPYLCNSKTSKTNVLSEVLDCLDCWDGHVQGLATWSCWFVTGWTTRQGYVIGTTGCTTVSRQSA